MADHQAVEQDGDGGKSNRNPVRCKDEGRSSVLIFAFMLFNTD